MTYTPPIFKFNHVIKTNNEQMSMVDTGQKSRNY